MPPRTVVVAGGGTNTASFTIPPGVEFTPESVVASVDDSAGGDTIAELSVADQSGVVIAAKRQSTPIPGGDTGLATWALRLDDELADLVRGEISSSLSILGEQVTDVRLMTREPGVQFGSTLIAPLTAVWHFNAGQSFSVDVENLTPDIHLPAVWSGSVTRLSTGQVEDVLGPAILLAPGASGTLALAHGAGAALLNYATPTAPAVVNADTYALMFSITWS
jgi:hypothetical protein